MLKVLIVVAVLLGAAFSIPALRQYVEPVVTAVTKPARNMVGAQLTRVRDPVFRWAVRNEARNMARELVQRDREGQPLPRPQDFQSYLTGRTLAQQPVLDRWGSPYYLLVAHDSVTVVSPGPDTRPGTEDDIRAPFPRR